MAVLKGPAVEQILFPLVLLTSSNSNQLFSSVAVSGVNTSRELHAAAHHGQRAFELQPRETCPFSLETFISACATNGTTTRVCGEFLFSWFMGGVG